MTDAAASLDDDIGPSPRGGDGSWRYDVFISYRTQSSSWCARRLDRGLRAIAKRHSGGGGIRVFRDASTLRAGPLGEDLLDKLCSSRCLVVVLDCETVGSEWVSVEISTWLDTVGSPDRLFLVRSDPELNLNWNKVDGRFEDPDALPIPLRDVFTSEQLWIDLSRWRAVGTESRLALLCAPILGVQPETFLIEEARHQKRQRRRLMGVLAVVSLLLVATTVSAVSADRSRDRAKRSQAEAVRSEMEAVAQADAAEAILAARDTPILAIERAITASRGSDSPTIRSAMLAVSEEARRLRRTLTYPEDATGHPPSAVAFHEDTFLAWGPTDDDGSFVQAWDLLSSETRFAGTVDVSELADVRWLEPATVVGCSAVGPLTATFTGERTEVTVLDTAWSADSGDECAVGQFAGGVLALVVPAAADTGVAYYVDPRGRVTTLEGVASAVSDPLGRTALVSGRAGVAVVGPEGVQNLTSQPAAEAAFADRRGHFLVHIAGSTWAFVTPGAEGASLRTFDVPDETVEVAPILDGAELTGELAWITADGTIGWTGGDATTQVLRNSDDAPDAPGYRTTLEPMENQQFVAVVGRTIVVVDGPGSFSEEPPVGYRTGWEQTSVESLLPPPTQAGSDPVRATCESRRRVILGEWTSDVSPYLVDDRAQARVVAGRGSLGHDCSVVEVEGSVVATDSFGEQIEVRSNVVADGVAVAPSGSQLAILRDGEPIEILSAAREGELPTTWEMSAVAHPYTVVAAMGELQLSSGYESRATELLVEELDGSVDTFPVPDRGRFVAVRPDGRGGVWETTAPEGERDRFIVGDHDDGAVDDACGGRQSVRYVPAKAFRMSLAAAEAQIPVVDTDEGFVDCRTGEPLDIGRSVSVLEYEIGRRKGRIMSRNRDDALEITTWRPGDVASLRSTTWPDAPETAGIVSLDETERTVVLADHDDARELTVYRRDGDGWRRSAIVESSLGHVAEATLADHGTLLLVVASDGAFELYDAQTGRRLVTGTDPQGGTRREVTGLIARRFDDILYASLMTDGEPDQKISIEIPIGIPALTDQLCAIHHAADCP